MQIKTDKQIKQSISIASIYKIENLGRNIVYGNNEKEKVNNSLINIVNLTRAKILAIMK